MELFKDIDMEIRKHELIIYRLKNIQECELILQGKSNQYKKYMEDGIFVRSVKQRLEIERELIKDLYVE